MLHCSLRSDIPPNQPLEGLIWSAFFLLPMSFWSWRRRRLVWCRVPAAHPVPPPQGSSWVPDETVMLGQILFLEEAAFPGGSVAWFSGAVYVSPLCLVNQWTSGHFACCLPALELLATLAVLRCRMRLEHDGVCSQAGQVSSHGRCRALLALPLHFPKLN